MSWKASAYIKQLVVCPNGERISRTEKLVALVLADSHQDKGKTFTFPAVKMIAEDALMDPRVCRRILAGLERKGVIERERADRQGRGQLTFYRFPALDQKEDTASSFATAERGTGRPPSQKEKGGRKEDGRRTKRGSPPMEEQEQEQMQIPTPQPPASQGGRVLAMPAAASDLALDQAAGEVGNGVGIRKPRLLKRIHAVIEAECELTGSPPGEIAADMIAAWNEQARLGHLLFRRFSAMEMLELGMWKQKNQWNWDKQALREAQLATAASVGSFR